MVFDGDNTRGNYEVTLKMRDLYALFKRAIEYQEMPKSDKDAVAQNFCCLVEKKLGIFPNIPGPRLED